MPHLLLALFLPAQAADVDTFTPASSLAVGAGSLQGEAPQLGDEGASGTVSMGLAQDPVVRTFDDRASQAAVDALAPLTLHGGYTFGTAARVDVLLPIYTFVGADLVGYRGAAVGDLRLQTTAPVWADDTLTLALVPRLQLPTGRSDALVGDGFGGGLLASLGADDERMGWVLNAGTTLRRAERLEPGAPGLGSSLDLLGSAWWHVADGLRVGGELALAQGLVRGDDGGGTNRTGSLHAFGQTQLGGGLGLVAGAGTGLIAGLGTPEAHGFLALTWGQMERDSDGDGIVDAVDACPNDPEDADGFEDGDGCPDIDNDGDRVLDVADRCPMVPEDLDGWLDDDGCPDADNDDDGLLDADDACPVDAGPVATSGCPDRDGDTVADASDACPDDPGPVELGGCPDRDGDLVPDHRDACPDEPKPPAEDPATSDGCPKTVFISPDEIKITERIEFETGSARLLPSADRILEQVASVLRDHPEVELLEIQGHTDNVGSTSYNVKLSDQRAQSVKAWLEAQGIDGARLAATGYGEGMPIASNRTPKGRETNRRVQFKILRAAGAPPPSPSRRGATPPPAEERIDGSDMPSPWGETEGTDADGTEGSPWGER